MAMKTVNVHEAKTQLSALLAQIEESGETVRICRHGKPVADLVPHRKHNRLKPHPVMGKVRLHYDPTEPLGEGEWPEDSR
jgi:antitoxin (DNA-binding transcriptional repressor) of toxin-antitoxin stability system